MGRKTVKMRADFDTEGIPIPLKFKVCTETTEELTIPVSRVIKRETNNFAGNKMLVYQCESQGEGGILKTYELRYEIDTCKWYLYF